MALYALRLRRALTLSSSLLHHSLHRPTPSLPFPTAPLIPQNPTTSLKPPFPQPDSSRFFTSTTTSLSSRGRAFEANTDDIGPDTILFEGCDYNHWLIVVDFPKDPEPSREEMISFYEQTAAKIFGSLEEAKKKIYACSTTTYKGFQVECSEDTSDKFHGLPGVIFVLPDSYIDPINKEYGGDKYINGQIIPRPPPVQYGRQGPRRDFRSRPSPRGPMQGDSRNFGPPQTPPPQQNFGLPPPPQHNFGQPPPSQQNFGQPPPSQQNFGQPPPPQQNYGQPRLPQPNYGPPQNFPPQQNYGPPGSGPTPASNVPGGWDNSQGGRRDSMPSYQPNYNQGDRGNFYPQGQRDCPHGDQRSYPPPDNRSFSGPVPQGGNFGQAPDGAQGQQTGPAYGQNYPADQRNMTQGVDQRDNAAMGNAPTDQGRY